MKPWAVARVVLVMFLWAVCFPLIVAGFSYAPHLTFATLRAVVAGGALLAVALWLRRPWPRGWRVWGTLAMVGLGATSLAYLGMFNASEFVSPGIATVIANTQPLLAAVLASLFLGEFLNLRGKIGLALGFSGIVVIALPQFSTPNAQSYLEGIGYILLAALGITVSNVLIRKIAMQVDAMMAMGIQLMLGALPLAIGAAMLEDPRTVEWSYQFLLILAGLALFGSSLAYWLWSDILKTVELNRANAFSFLVPVFGLAMGALFFNERMGWIEALGIGLSLAGIAMAVGGSASNRKPVAPPAAARDDASKGTA